MGEGSPLFGGEPSGAPERVDDFMRQILFRIVGVYAEQNKMADVSASLVQGGEVGDAIRRRGRGRTGPRLRPAARARSGRARWHGTPIPPVENPG